MNQLLKILLVAFLFIPYFLSAKAWEVCETCKHTSIQETINISDSGDTLMVKEGIYREFNILIDRPLSLIGEGFPTIDGEHQGEILIVRADSVLITGFQIKRVGVSYIEDQAGIRVENVSYCQIINNRLYDTFFGIYLAHVNFSQVENNEVIGKAEQEISSGNAIHLWYCHHIRIRNNIAKHHRDGIYFEFVDESHISDNVSEHNLRYGLHFMFSDDNEYLNNRFSHNGAGVAVMFSRNIRMEGNHFLKNWGPTAYGLLLKEIYDSDIIHNEFRENTVGIFAESATRIHISHNDFIQNGWALKVLGSCMDDSVERNNFISNTFDIATNSSRNYNVYAENFWSEYTGYDLDRDGIGDVPYRPVKLYSYLVSKSSASLILLRSLFIDVLSFSEKIIPMLTPKSLIDERPLTKRIDHQRKLTNR